MRDCRRITSTEYLALQAFCSFIFALIKHTYIYITLLYEYNFLSRQGDWTSSLIYVCLKCMGLVYTLWAMVTLALIPRLCTINNFLLSIMCNSMSSAMNVSDSVVPPSKKDKSYNISMFSLFYGFHLYMIYIYIYTHIW